MPAEPRRVPVLALFAGLVAAGLVVEAVTGGGTGAVAGQPVVAGPVVGVPAQALVSTWFCAGATSGAGTGAPGELLLANAGRSPVRARVDLFTDGGRSEHTSVDVAPGTVGLVHERVGRPLPVSGGAGRLLGPGAQAPGDWVGAEVTVLGGLTTVSQVVVTPAGTTAQPCATAASQTWFFSAGEQLRNASEVLSLLNPSPVDEVVDMTFTTEQGVEQPGAFQGIVIPAHGLTTVAVGAHLRQRDHIAATLRSRSGTFVAFETELVHQPPAGAAPVGTPGAVNPVWPVAGVTLQLGSPAPARQWWWPAGGEGPGLTESYVVYDPGTAPARVQLGLHPSAGGPVSRTVLDVPAQGWASVRTNGQPWSLNGVPYWASLRSLNGVPVVAQRSLMAAPPAPTRGLAAMFGLGRPATSWALTETAVPEGGSAVQVLDPGARPASVRLYRRVGRQLRLLGGSPGFVVQPGQEVSAALPSGATDAVLVTSSVPVLADLSTTSVKRSTGTDLSPLPPVLGPPGPR